LVSPYLKNFTIFLISPGLRPCDYDEKCEAAKDSSEAICSHTQLIAGFPVIIDPKGIPYHEYNIDADFINAILKSEKIKIKNKIQVLELMKLFIFLNDPRRNTIEIEQLKSTVNRENGKYYIMIESMRNYKIKQEDVEIYRFIVSSTGNIQIVKNE